MLSSGSCLQRVAGLVLVLLSKFLVPILGLGWNFWFQLSGLGCVACFYIVYTSIARLMSFELML
jgi:hypothetical protein